MNRFRTFLGLCVLAAGCAESTPEPPHIDHSIRTQAVVDVDAPNWLVAGGPGLVEMVGGSDGEPDAITGRFALDGSTIVDASGRADRWVVVGPNTTQPLDDDAVRLAESRDALAGDTIGFITPGPVGWLIGGDNGSIQLLDAQGEPTLTMIQVLSNARITSAAHNGNAWLVGAENGNVVAVNTGLPNPGTPEGNTADGGAAITAIVADPSGTLTTPAFLAFTATSAVPTGAVGAPQTPLNVLATGEITTAAFGNGKVAIGTNDGRIGIADYSATPTFTFANVLNGAAVTRIVVGESEWLALGANGQAQRFDNAGNVLGQPAQIASRTDRPLVGAHQVDGGWRIVVGELGFVAFVDEQLTPPRELVTLLGGNEIYAASTSGAAVLIAGAGGRVQLLDTLGTSLGAPVTAAGGADVLTAAWSGDQWLVAGEGGAVQVVDAQGAPVGASSTLLGGQDIRFAAWSGEFFLVGGAGGNLQVVRPDGTASAAPYVIAGATDLYDARWSGRDWIVVGTDGTSGAFARVVPTDAAATATIVTTTGALRSVDFNGLEFLAGGDRGLIQRISAQGMPVDEPADVLSGFDIRDVHFNGVNYIVVGEFGAMRRLGQDYLPLRTPLALLDREVATTAIWTAPRGFASGACLTADLCFNGPCVGGLAQGRCCDAACDRACESCFQDDTGEPDGTCAPVVAGKQPPVKEGSAGCNRQSEATCGLTGACDGAGECAFYGAEIQCADAVCSLGQFTDSSSCNGAGACGLMDAQDCAPYAGCTIDGCVTSCNADRDCVDGFECLEQSCVEIEEDPGPTAPGDDDEADEGCCATVASSPSGTGAALLIAAAFLVVRGRR